jgi:hypothetical protein
MSFFSRFRFLLGLLVTAVLVGGLFFYLNYSMSNINSQSATLERDQYSVSANYGGVLEREYVKIGDTVKEGDNLFELNSPELAKALSAGTVQRNSLLFSVTDQGNILLKATTSGEVRIINYSRGSFVVANRDIATIALEDTDYVNAKFILNSPDYARINRSNPVEVTLPDNTKLMADVFDIALEKEGAIVFTVVKARFQDRSSVQPTFTSGTPVNAHWKLDNTSLFETLTRLFRSFVNPTSQA